MRRGDKWRITNEIGRTVKLDGGLGRTILATVKRAQYVYAQYNDDGPVLVDIAGNPTGEGDW